MRMNSEIKKTLADAKAMRAEQDRAELESRAKEIKQAKAEIERFESEFSGLSAEEMQRPLSYDEMSDGMKKGCGSSEVKTRACFIGMLKVHAEYLSNIFETRHNQIRLDYTIDIATKVMKVIGICLTITLIYLVVSAIMR